MALRVLSSTEKEVLKSDADFKAACQWAVRDYASYWAIHDGASLGTEALRIKWAKDRINAVAIENNDIADQDISLKFLKLGKGIEVDLPAGDQLPSVIITAWKAGNKFEECASMFFDMLGETINMSKTGN